MGRAYLVAGGAGGAADFLRPAKLEDFGLHDPLHVCEDWYWSVHTPNSL